ncbi:hypothetical protein [Atopomonas sediminilitoris]|uniref:hypothetical protein n=1 Tax=Atopomonas sediminilitoris TaxID=2919919 RepID=UPI001F4D80F7|nr:hypothetical protein [Atopomonas sediminilitoris]MCJ8169055.1 hypothetical protein [Atopomonas sediminilitoris]
MKKILTAITIAALLPLAAFAQEGEGKRDHMKHMAKELNLSEEQRNQVREIVKKHMEAGRLEVRSILNDEQRAKFDQMHEKRKAMMEERKAKRDERRAERDDE